MNCMNLSHGITCLSGNRRIEGGKWRTDPICRVCSGSVSDEDVILRRVLERIRDNVRSTKRLLLDAPDAPPTYVQAAVEWVKHLEDWATEILGEPDKTPTTQSVKL